MHGYSAWRQAGYGSGAGGLFPGVSWLMTSPQCWTERISYPTCAGWNITKPNPTKQTQAPKVHSSAKSTRVTYILKVGDDSTDFEKDLKPLRWNTYPGKEECVSLGATAAATPTGYDWHDFKAAADYLEGRPSLYLRFEGFLTLWNAQDFHRLRQSKEALLTPACAGETIGMRSSHRFLLLSVHNGGPGLGTLETPSSWWRACKSCHGWGTSMSLLPPRPASPLDPVATVFLVGFFMLRQLLLDPGLPEHWPTSAIPFPLSPGIYTLLPL